MCRNFDVYKFLASSLLGEGETNTSSLLFKVNVWTVCSCQDMSGRQGDGGHTASLGRGCAAHPGLPPAGSLAPGPPPWGEAKGWVRRGHRGHCRTRKGQTTWVVWGLFYLFFRSRSGWTRSHDSVTKSREDRLSFNYHAAVWIKYRKLKDREDRLRHVKVTRRSASNSKSHGNPIKVIRIE